MRTYVFGDTHGCYDLARRLVAKVGPPPRLAR